MNMKTNITNTNKDTKIKATSEQKKFEINFVDFETTCVLADAYNLATPLEIQNWRGDKEVPPTPLDFYGLTEEDTMKFILNYKIFKADKFLIYNHKENRLYSALVIIVDDFIGYQDANSILATLFIRTILGASSKSFFMNINGVNDPRIVIPAHICSLKIPTGIQDTEYIDFVMNNSISLTDVPLNIAILRFSNSNKTQFFKELSNLLIRR